MAPPYDLVALTNNGFGRIATAHIPALSTHDVKPLGIAQNLRDGASQAWAGQFRLWEQQGASSLSHHLRIAQLMIVNRSREGDQNCRLSAHSKLSDRHGARSGDHKISRTKHRRHVVQKWHHLSGDSSPVVSGDNPGVVGFARLMCNGRAVFHNAEQRQCLDDC
jgi:hypothetical protein